MQFDENSTCHFFDVECQFPIPEDALKEIQEAEEDDVIAMIPAMDDLMCTNCLLATMIDLLAQKLK